MSADREDRPHTDQPWRCFVALPLPEPARAAFIPRLRELAAGIPEARWVPVPNLHLTLVFLGDTQPTEVPAIVAELGRVVAGVAPFELRLEGPGTFGGRGRPAVVWLGVAQGASRVAELAAAIEHALRPDELGGAEREPHRPHLTVARVRTRKLAARALERLTDVSVGWRVAEVELLRSHLGTGPPRYETLAWIPLGGPPEDDAASLGGTMRRPRGA
ncbi:MAG TPA: RNA 2',3'-cyclic phosphodiesterase [Candidatus Limnocylindrales bacterium]|nr:RNA 2',3'-cyclic phosphodiesterase [Candidatus Limnocylindrales bacterium]